METIDNLTLVREAAAPKAQVKTRTTQTATVSKQLNTWDRHALAFENARYFWMALMLTFQSCLGAVACMYILQSNASTFVLSVCAALSMGSNALFIGLAPAKWCLVGFYLSVVVNTAFLLANL